MTNEKIMVVNNWLGSNAEITTVDTTKRNQINKWDVEYYSHKELADKIYNRAIKDGYTKIYVDANGINVGLNDWLVSKFEGSDFNFNPKTGSVVKKSVIVSGVATHTSGIVDWGNVISAKIGSKEEF